MKSLRILDIAFDEVGNQETGVNEIKYNDWYYGKHVSGGAYPWCAVFVSWVADQAGVPTSVIPKTASVLKLYKFFLDNNQFHKPNNYLPQAGDILIQKSDGASHTGIVYNSDDLKVYVVEGNSDGKVAITNYYLDDPKITGYGTPKYPVGHKARKLSVRSNVSARDMDGLGVGKYSYVSYTVKTGDTLQTIAAKYNTTVAMIVFINNISGNISVGQTLQVPKPPDPEATSQTSTGVTTLAQQHTAQVSVSHPTIKVEFYGEYGKLASTSATSTVADTKFDHDIISCTTVRNMGQDCPTFSLSMVWRNKWYDNLASNDLIIITMQRPPENACVVMYGLIDDIRKVIDFSSGQPQRAVQVTGRGFNKAFVNFDVGLIENVSIDLGTGFFANLTQLSGCDSFNAIQLVWNSYVGTSIKYQFANGKNFEDYVAYTGNVHDNEILVDYESYTNYSGSLWNFIKELGNAPFNETFWEVTDDVPCLIHRRTPFNKVDWEALPRKLIRDYDIVSDNTGRSDLETYTVYSVQQSLMGEEYTNVYPPLWYPAYYPKYGISQLKVSTVYESGTGDTQSAIKSYTTDLFNFNIKNNVFANGTLVVKGKAQYKVGERAFIESENMEYYIESVTQSFNCFGKWTTSLGLTRGIQPELRFTTPWGCAEELTAEVMNAIVSQTSGQSVDWTNLPQAVGTSIGYSGTGNGDGYEDGQLTWPVPGHKTITSPFGPRKRPTKGASTYHKGIDIGAPLGTPIIAASKGRVIASGPASGFGNWIKVDHGGGMVSIYGHMKTLYAKVGQQVSAGERIALVGNEGHSSGPHLHFQLEINGSAVDPTPYFNRKTNGKNGTNGNTSENEKAVYKYLTGTAGLSPAAACGVMGNINQESGFRVKCDGDGGTSYGLCQWHNARKTNLINFCKTEGYELQSVEGQMAFMVHELKSSYKNVWQSLCSCTDNAQGAYNSAVIFCNSYEVPANAKQKSRERGNSAKTFYAKYVGG